MFRSKCVSNINFLIIIVFFTVSLVILGRVPQALYWDELAIGIDAYSITQTGKDIHGNSWLQAIYPSYGDYKAPLPIWLVSLSIRIFGMSAFAVRLPFFLLSWLGLMGLAWILKQMLELLKLKNSLLIYFTLLLIMLTPWYWHFSHIGFESGMSLSLLIWTIAFCLWSIHKQGWGLILSSVFAVLTIYTYFSARIIVPIFIAVLLFVFVKKAVKKWYWILVAVILFIAGLQPLLKSPFYQASQQLRWSADNMISDGKAISQSANLINQSGNVLIARIVYHRYWFMAKSFLQNYLTHYSINFLSLNGDSNLRHHIGWGGELLFVQFILLLLGLYWSVKNWHSPIVWLAGFWFLMSPITASIPYEVPHASRAIYMLIPISIFYLFGLIELIQIFRQSKFVLKKLIIFGFLILIINFAFYFEDYLNHYPGRSKDAWQFQNREMTNTALSNYDQYSQIVISDTYRLPALSILFYQPNFIKQIQVQNQIKQDSQYIWLNSFDKFLFTNTNNWQLEKNQLVIK